MDEQPKGVPIERLVGAIALCTTGYYLFTYLIEVGFSWLIGLQYVSAFSLSDHVNHAAASSLGIIGSGLFVVVLFALMFGYVPLHVAASSTDSETAPSADSNSDNKALWRKVIWTLVLLSFQILLVLAIFYRTDARPSSAFMLLIVIASGSFALRAIWQGLRKIWIVPFVLAIAISPVAFGDMLFQSEVSKDIIKGERLKIGDNKIAGRAIFIGSDKAIYRTSTGLYLATFDGSTVIRIVPDAPPYWRLPSKFPCKPRPRNDRGPRTLVCETEPPPQPGALD